MHLSAFESLHFERKLDALFEAERETHRKLDLILNALEIEMTDLTALTAQVQQNTSVIESAKTLINGLAQQLADAGTDPAKLQALQDQLKAEDDALAQAVAANTPAAQPAT